MFIKDNINTVDFDCNNSSHVDNFIKLFSDYIEESNICEENPNIDLNKWTKGIINDTLQENRFLNMICLESNFIGFTIYHVNTCKIEGFLYTSNGNLEKGHSEWAYIDEFYIMPTYRRKGYGSLVYKEIANFIKSKNLDCIWLTAENQGILFWAANGFKSINRNAWNGLEIFKVNL